MFYTKTLNITRKLLENGKCVCARTYYALYTIVCVNNFFFGTDCIKSWSSNVKFYGSIRSRKSEKCMQHVRAILQNVVQLGKVQLRRAIVDKV